MARLTIGRRFGVVVLLVLLLVAAVSAIGAVGVSRMNDEVNVLYEDEYTNTLQSARLSRALRAAEVVAVQAAQTGYQAAAARLHARLDRRLLPAVDAALRVAKTSSRGGPSPRRGAAGRGRG